MDHSISHAAGPTPALYRPPDDPAAAPAPAGPAVGQTLIVGAWLETDPGPALPPPADAASEQRLRELIATLETLIGRPAADGPAERLIGKDAVADAYGVSPRTIERWHDAEKIPAAVLHEGGLRWRQAEIAAHIRAGCPERRVWTVLAKGLGYRPARKSS